MSAESDFLIPCDSARRCRAILESAQIDVPEELIGLTANQPSSLSRCRQQPLTNYLEAFYVIQIGRAALQRRMQK